MSARLPATGTGCWMRWQARADQAQRRRWLVAIMAAMLLGTALAAASQYWMSRSSPVPPPPAAIMITLAEEVRSPSPSVEPEGERQIEAAPPVPQRPRQPSPVEVPPAPSELMLPQVEELPLEEPLSPAPETEQPTPPVVQTSAPPGEEAPPAQVATSPQLSAFAAVAREAQASFEQRLLGHLERHKRYPRSARMRRQEGVPYVRFTMDREGIVLSARLEQASGHALLDAEALALLERAQPLPPLPPEIPGERMEIVVPVEFFLRR